MARTGRPSLFTKKLADIVCARLAEGESLRQICRDESMPGLTTVLKWSRELPDFATQYAQAREALLEHWAEEINEIADDGSNDWIEREVKAGRIDTVPDQEHINRSRLRVDSRKWLLSKLGSKKYGDKIEQHHTGEVTLKQLIEQTVSRGTDE